MNSAPRRILCTMPGKHGDLLWSLLTCRALAEAQGPGGTVDLLVSPKYSSLLPLIRLQPYIGVADRWPAWTVQDTAPMTPWSPFEETLHALPLIGGGDNLAPYNYVVHLGYRAWPDQPLPFCIYEQTRRLYPDVPIAPLTLADLQRPWIQGDVLRMTPVQVTYGFSQQHFELKVGMVQLLLRRFGLRRFANVSTGDRWAKEAGCPGYNWVDAACRLAASDVAVCCNSSLHVLACAVGTPVVMMEPDKDRWNPVFYPLGKSGAGVELVLGMDGLPTFDARHVGDAVVAVQRPRAEARADKAAVVAERSLVDLLPDCRS